MEKIFKKELSLVLLFLLTFFLAENLEESEPPRSNFTFLEDSIKIDSRTIDGVSNNDYFGVTTDFIGDLDGDGVVDLAVGAPWDDDGFNQAGAFYILFMNSDGTVKSYRKIGMHDVGDILVGNDVFGYSISSMGDLDGDGVEDIAVGSPMLDDVTGRVFILFMNKDGSVKSYTHFNNTNMTGNYYKRERFGGAVANIGDLDGDGVVDLAIGAYNDNDGGNGTGAVWISFMNSDGTVKTSRKINDSDFEGGLDVSGAFGMSVEDIGDLDGDGYEDIVVGNYLADSSTGEAWIIFLNSTGNVKDYTKINTTSLGGGLTVGGWFGVAVENMGDLDGDGIQDIVIGNYGDDDGGTNRGAWWLLNMNSDGSVKSYSKYNTTNSTIDFTTGTEPRYGSAFAVADLDGDGSSEIVVGSQYDDVAGVNDGSLFIHFTVCQG